MADYYNNHIDVVTTCTISIKIIIIYLIDTLQWQGSILLWVIHFLEKDRSMPVYLANNIISCTYTIIVYYNSSSYFYKLSQEIFTFQSASKTLGGRGTCGCLHWSTSRNGQFSLQHVVKFIDPRIRLVTSKNKLGTRQERCSVLHPHQQGIREEVWVQFKCSYMTLGGLKRNSIIRSQLNIGFVV